MPFPGSTANFNEPQSNDTTSAPQMPDQQQNAVIQRAQGIASGLAGALAKRKKAGLIGPSVKAPSTLTAAIARARRARQGGEKYG
jgi:hypothetical protein